MPVGNVEVRSLSSFTAVQNLFVSGTLTTSGSVSLGAAVYDVDSHLELSSAAGSVVAVSASMDFPNTDRAYHILARNGPLILSSSVTSTVFISSSLEILGGGTNFPLYLHAAAVSSRFASIGDVGTEYFGFYSSPTRRFRLVSSDIDLVTAGQKIYHSTDALILSSSVTSKVFVSGALSSSDGIWSAGQMQAVSNIRCAADFIGSDPTSVVRNNNNTYWLGADKLEFRRSGKISFDADIIGAGVGGDEFQIVNAKGYGFASSAPSGTLGLSSSRATSVVNGMTLASLRGDLILSASETSFVVISGNLMPLSGVYIRGTASNDIKLTCDTNAILNVNTSTGGAASVLASAYRDSTTFNLTADQFEFRLGGRYGFGGLTSGVSGTPEFSLISGRAKLSPGNVASGTLALSSSNTTATVNGMTVASMRGHLILSSSEGSQVMISGALTPQRVTTATLLAGADIVTGSIMWDDTRKTLKIYGPLGWTPILTGTAG